MGGERATLRVSNIPQTVVAKELWAYLESVLGPDSIFALEISTERKNWKPRGFGRVQFSSLHHRSAALSLSLHKRLVFKSHTLKLHTNFYSDPRFRVPGATPRPVDDIVPRPAHARNRVDDSVLHAGFLENDGLMWVMESWVGVRAWLMPETNRLEFWLWQEETDCYKLEIMFQDVLEAVGCCLDDGDQTNAVLLKLKYAPRIYKKISGPNIESKFKPDRYHIYKEDHDFLWVRTTEFARMKPIGMSTSFCWKVEEGLPASEIFKSLPYYKEDSRDLIFEDGEVFFSPYQTIPLVKCDPSCKLAYEVCFQLNALVHGQKLSLAAVDIDLLEILNNATVDSAIMVLQKLQTLKSICYEPLSFIKTQLHALKENRKNLPSSSHKRLLENSVMSCHRAYITPTKIYCLGPELEKSNYVVKHFASYASDFMRVTFVEEDWSKLPPNALSVSIQQGVCSKPYRTSIYNRILSVLKEGIVIGDKRFEFLAFSASQLRSNSVWMFASNDNVKAEDIREWMGCFNKIRSVSKCSARMGQLFSSSSQTLVVPVQDVEVIPDIEVTSDGISYCFSDGIGKVSLSFAKQIAQKCGLTYLPSAFQIRFGGYKGVIAVDRNSFRKLSLRNSMLKFESKNRMLNVTKWTEYGACYLNREIVTLLSTLGVKDEAFVAMQEEQLRLLRRMLTEREAALKVLESVNGPSKKGKDGNMMIKMLRQGYKPNQEPYLSMMLQAHYDYLLTDIRGRCRVFVPKGRVMIGCLDETGILDYGEVFVRVTMTKEELQHREQSFFQNVDDETSVVVGKVVVTKNPCLHPGDVRVLTAVYKKELDEKGLVDCLVFPQKGPRPHPNECSGGDLDGDLYFICWDEDLIPTQTVPPMDYTARRPRIMDHDVKLEEIQQFFVDYMISDTLGSISTAHLVHADNDPDKAMSPKCIELANLHSMAVDFAKTGAPAEMPKYLKPREFPDFMGRGDRSSYTSQSALGKLYRATFDMQEVPNIVWSETLAEASYDKDLEVIGFESFLKTAETHKSMYEEKMSYWMIYFGLLSEDEMLTGNIRKREAYLQRDNRRYFDTKDRIVVAARNIQKEAKGWFESSCEAHEHEQMASAWYHVTYHPSYCGEGLNCLSFPWVVGDVLLNIKSCANSREVVASED